MPHLEARRVGVGTRRGCEPPQDHWASPQREVHRLLERKAGRPSRIACPHKSPIRVRGYQGSQEPSSRNNFQPPACQSPRLSGNQEVLDRGHHADPSLGDHPWGSIRDRRILARIEEGLTRGHFKRRNGLGRIQAAVRSHAAKRTLPLPSASPVPTVPPPAPPTSRQVSPPPPPVPGHSDPSPAPANKVAEYCPRCGAANHGDALFCERCGSQFSKVAGH
jgi:hypothetical protein